MCVCASVASHAPKCCALFCLYRKCSSKYSFSSCLVLQLLLTWDPQRAKASGRLYRQISGTGYFEESNLVPPESVRRITATLNRSVLF
jgi:hypothetical protein